jgi:hypothetical protein
MTCALFGLGWDISAGYSFEQHGEPGSAIAGSGTVISGHYTKDSIENYHYSTWVASGGFFNTSGNNINVTVGASFFVGKAFCTADWIICGD